MKKKWSKNVNFFIEYGSNHKKHHIIGNRSVRKSFISLETQQIGKIIDEKGFLRLFGGLNETFTKTAYNFIFYNS